MVEDEVPMTINCWQTGTVEAVLWAASFLILWGWKKLDCAYLFDAGGDMLWVVVNDKPDKETV